MSKRQLIFAVLLLLSHEIPGNFGDLTDLVTNFTVHLVKTQQAILFGCTRQAFLAATASLMQSNQLTQVVHLNKNYTLIDILTRWNHARTSVVVDCSCNASAALLEQASELHYFNKTYQWLLCDPTNRGVYQILPNDLEYLGPNAQVTYVNGSNENFLLWDLHSKGLHLSSPLEMHLIAEWKNAGSGGYFIDHINIFEQQGIKKRGQFNGLILRGASVIDQDNVTTNEDIIKILSRATKDSGVATFIKYHYSLLTILSERFNFTVKFRNSRGWAGRLGNTTFRLGLLGVVKRNEADVAASGSFTRINRFADFDTIHQSWKFETGFLYRFTPDLDAHGKSGNFLAPFDDDVWCYAIAILLMVNFIWRLVEWLKKRWRLNGELKYKQQLNIGSESAAAAATATACDAADVDGETTLTAVSLKTFAAVCQQGMEPLPTGLSSRTIVLTMFVFSLVMYNFYTSSVVGGLLSSTAQGPATVADVISSPLKLSFEDIGYYKILFKDSKTPLIKTLLKVKLLPKRNPTDLPVYAHVEDAIPYLKKGGFAFHCEVLDAYPGITKIFDVDDICDLRMVSGLLETEVFNWIVPKRSQYTEIFRIVMTQAREAGIVKRTLNAWRAKKPQCLALYRVFPISLSGVLSAYFILLGNCGITIYCLFVARLKHFQNLYF